MSSPASQMCNPSQVGGENCENSIRFQLEDVNFIEFEEFHPEKQSLSSTKHKENDISIENVNDKIAKCSDKQQESKPQETVPVQHEAFATDRSGRSAPSQVIAIQSLYS